jgi:GntR family transcriptional regulator, transcriptional repressor for pyruvate dehydrogenase complex
MMQQEDFLPTIAGYLIETARENAGKAPSERDLADHFAVSRGQVREALAILEAMQVIERRAKSGIYDWWDRGDVVLCPHRIAAGESPDL